MRFILQPSEDSNYWICTDTVNKIVCKFKEHKFNDTQEFTELDNCNIEIMQMAKIMREFGDWLRENHYHKIF